MIKNNFLLAIIDQFLTSGATFILITIAARNYLSASVAEYAYIFSAYLLFSMFVQNFFVHNRLLKKNHNKDSLYNCRVSFFILVCFYSVVATMALDLFAKIDHTSVFVVILYLILICTYDYERRMSYVINNLYVACAASGAYLFIAISTFYIFKPSSINGYFLCIIFALIPSLAYFLYRVFYEKGTLSIKEFLISCLANSYWLVFNIPINWLWGQAPLFAIGWALGAESAGVFAVVRSLVNISNIPLEMLNTYWQKKLSKLRQKSVSEYKIKIYYMVFIGLLIWMGGELFLTVSGRDTIQLILGAKFCKYYNILELLYLNVLLVILTRILIIHAKLSMNTKVIFFSFLFGTLLLFFLFSILNNNLREIIISMNIASFFVVAFQVVFLKKIK